MELQLPTSFPIIFSFFLFVIMVINILTRRGNTRNSTSKLPPGPWRLPLVGNIHQLFGSLPHHALRNLAKKHGPLMYLRIGQVPIIVVSSPESAEAVLRTHDAAFASRPRLLFPQIMAYDCTDIAFAPYGEYWRQLRKICTQELLSPTRVQSFKHVREEEMFDLIEWIALNVGSAINLTERIQKLTFGITSRAAFGKKSRDHEEFVSIVVETVEVSVGFELVDFFPSFSFLSKISSSRPKLERLKSRAEGIIEDIIKDHKESGEKGRDEDLVDVLLKFHNNSDHGISLTSDNLKAVIWDIFGAGSETSATTVQWAMAELIRNPSVMKNVQDEVREVFRRKGSVDETGLTEMTYLKSVVKETLRLHPPLALLIPRECREKYEINGYEIPAKSRLIVNAWAIGRDPRYWTEPESFIPERFHDSSIDYKGNDFEFIPFGAGRRICPGILFGIIEIELPLAFLLYHFDWKLPNGMKHEDLDMSEYFGGTLRRNNVLQLIPTAYDLSTIRKTLGS